MRKHLIIVLAIAVAVSNACTKEVAPRASNRNKNQAGTDVAASQQVSTGTTPETPSSSQTASSKLKNGYVPDEQTAIAIAVAVWTPIYGKAQIESEKPFRATLRNGIWTVGGTLPEGHNGG